MSNDEQRSRVSLIRTDASPTAGQIHAAVSQVVAQIGGLEDLVRPGDMVLIKPNLVAMPTVPNSGATTHPEVCRVLADMVSELGGRPVIAESSAVGVNTGQVIAVTGYDQLRERGYEVVDLKPTPTVTLPVPSGAIMKKVEVFELAAKADLIISVPVMKTHDQLEATLSLKNLKGLLPDEEKKRFHAVGVVEAMVDLVGILQPRLAVIDGIFCQEGLGPIYGTPIEMDLMLASRDLVAADTVAGLVMGFAPEELDLHQLAAKRGLGLAEPRRIEIVGESVESVRRQFKRFSEAMVVDVPDLKIVFQKGTCTGCHNTVLSSIFDMQNDGLLDHLRGKRIVAGLIDEDNLPNDVAPENLILVGKCVRQHRDRGRWVRGCPPNNVWVIQAIIGGPIQRRYATDGITD